MFLHERLFKYDPLKSFDGPAPQHRQLPTEGTKVNDFLLTDKEVADLAKVRPNTVKYWRQKGLLPFVKVGKHPRTWLSDFNRVFKKPATMDFAGDIRRQL